MDFYGQLSNGGAVWTLMLFNTQDSLKYERIEVGTITGEEMHGGCDVDDLVERIWPMIRPGRCTYLELNLMLVSGKVVKVQASFDGKRVRVIKVDFDRTTFPSGLKGRWVDVVFDRPIRGRRALALA